LSLDELFLVNLCLVFFLLDSDFLFLVDTLFAEAHRIFAVRDVVLNDAKEV
jgi:hypothetical protein